MARKGQDDTQTAEPTAPASSANGAPPWQGELPLFYKNPQLLSAERHPRAGIKEKIDLGFSRDTNAVPLGADEIFAAQFDFPVVFTETNPALPIAVLGVGGNRNAFVDAAGQWRVNTYIPAYIRRYPFIFATGIAPGQTHVAIDEAAACFDPEGGQKLFDADGPSKFTRQAIEFCRAFQVQIDLARAFGEAVETAGLLLPKRVDIQLPDGKRMSLEHFRIIDEARFDALPDATFLAWRRRGWLGLVYAHFLSMRRWQGFAVPPAKE
jgi:hypothetical protein